MSFLCGCVIFSFLFKILFQFFQWMNHDHLCTVDPHRDQFIALLEENAWLLSVSTLVVSILLYCGAPQWLSEYVLPRLFKPLLLLWSRLVRRSGGRVSHHSARPSQSRCLVRVWCAVAVVVVFRFCLFVFFFFFFFATPYSSWTVLTSYLLS
jgi:hypothetical protein